MLSNQNRYRAPPLAAEKRAASRPEVVTKDPATSVTRGDKREPKSLNEGHHASEKR